VRRNSRIYVAGDEFIAAAIRRLLERRGYGKVLGGPGQGPRLADARSVEAFFRGAGPEYVFLAAGRSGGIRANQKYPADLMTDNLLVECNVIRAAHRHGVRKLLYLASSCCYPRECPQPMRVESLMTGPLEPTSRSYALAKLAGIGLCDAYRRQHGANFVTAIPANAFGPGDDFSPEDSHVVGALLQRMHQAKLRGEPFVEIWGTGRPRREFIYSDDLASACLFLMRRYDGPDPINVGSGEALSVAQLAELVRGVVGYRGELRYDRTKPDGMPLKVLDTRPLRALGWRPRFTLRAALKRTYDWFRRAARGGRA